uniref:Uncharacterized protein n=1 Tax=Rhizophora mucronata TaxID=61149 RepID=A0A2P2PVJ2_RHIMU
MLNHQKKLLGARQRSLKPVRKRKSNKRDM